MNAIKKLGVRQVLFVALILMCAPFLYLSCAPDTGFNTVADYDVVITLYDKDFNYASLATYTLVDTVMHIYDEDNPPADDEISRQFDDLILTTIDNNMKAYGYQEVDPDQETPDVFVVVQVTITEYTGAGYVPGYGGWCGYWCYYGGWPGWGPGWGGYYPGYWYSYEFSTGTIFMDFWDGKESTDEDIIIRWQGTMNGLLGDTSSGASNRITRGINRAYEQSPYLKQTN